ncbi:N-formylglutamate amidohydrolase [Novosphingobium guangzhouense]|uniref:N-formylglutamate amidohydrolase n=1 Tax=Novosphingobium guangzhouense TaxID=1850347 RepID=UPI001B80A915|nr:N-formylglutamate amidohydrolase [Novosphingobium guangzhouense]
METEFHRLLGTPVTGGVLVVSDHASNRVPDDIDLGIDAALLDEHIAIDIGVAAIGARMVEAGTAAWLGNVSRLVCDFNRTYDVPGMMPEISDGHAIPGNMLTPQERQARVDRFFDPYHAALAAQLAQTPPALILSLHSFTPGLATCTRPRPWQVGVLYNEDERAARIAIPWLEAQGFVTGDQEPYSGKLLNASMNRHAEPNGLPYLSIEIRQDLIAEEAGQEEWARVMTGLCREVVGKLK